jgi:predicted site-specific integrase-resolvase
MDQPAAVSTTDNLSEKEAARTLGISRVSLFRLRRAGLIGYYCIGGRVLYSPEHLQVYLASVERRPDERSRGRNRS